MKNRLVLMIAFISFTAFEQMPNTLTKTEKVYGLSKFWQEVNYNFVYLNKVDRDAWDEEYKKLILEVQETKDDYGYYRLLQKFCALLKDGHTNVYLPKNIWEKTNNEFTDHKIQLTAIDGKAIITGINHNKKDELTLGTEVIKVNGLPTQQFLDNFVSPYISSSTDYVLQNWAVAGMFRAPFGTPFKVEFKLPDGTVKTLDLTVSDTRMKDPLFPSAKKRELLEFKWLKEADIAYVALNSFDDSEINAQFENILPELYKAKKIIIDLRNNGGGSTTIGKRILEHLTTDKVLYGSRSQTRKHIPSYKAWGKWTKEADTLNDAWYKKTFLAFRDELYHQFPYSADTVKLDKKRIVVPTALLISNDTASAAEDFLILADGQQHMIKIGEPSFGSTGQPMLFDMPGGGVARVCTKQDTYPDGREFVGVGIQPDLIVKKTVKDYRENRDPVLEAAVEQLENSKLTE